MDLGLMGHVPRDTAWTFERRYPGGLLCSCTRASQVMLQRGGGKLLRHEGHGTQVSSYEHQCQCSPHQKRRRFVNFDQRFSSTLQRRANEAAQS
eukprot:3285059-Rhodomonas_salina.1